MRSLLSIAAIAASALATSLATADAAPLRRTAAPADAYAQNLAQPFQPSSPFTSANPRLAQIDSQLSQAERTISADRRQGYITASEAQDAREEGRLIHNSALDSIAQNRGSIPDASYNALLGRLAALNQTIEMETSQH
ncbi:hypothetical protein SAZ10_09140 [Mesorhizobium sp. BAC0120]|uniref:hypothetical protein n=1 Tax=Mesorhizobium sp. BAC0120 TaxID=3090670 RepID=UPI00298D526F|nr:hypothetical protein [Mesorhizobium sp. BAC0120]MDW6021926.1 hypothetical protein [Mesorhizobium sp. BAC0120]